jgi:hypothetical protein
MAARVGPQACSLRFVASFDLPAGWLRGITVTGTPQHGALVACVKNCSSPSPADRATASNEIVKISVGRPVQCVLERSPCTTAQRENPRFENKL